MKKCNPIPYWFKVEKIENQTAITTKAEVVVGFVETGMSEEQIIDLAHRAYERGLADGAANKAQAIAGILGI